MPARAPAGHGVLGWPAPAAGGAFRPDPHADAGDVRVEQKRQPRAVRPAGGETGGLTAEERGNESVLVGRVVQPGQHVPRFGAQQRGAVAAEQLSGPAGQEGHPAALVERDEAVGEALREGGRPGAVRGRKRLHDERLVPRAHPLMPGGRIAQHLSHLPGGLTDPRPLGDGQLRAAARPQQIQRTPADSAGHQRDGVMGDGVRKGKSGTGKPAGERLLAGKPHGAPRADGLGHRRRRRQRQPDPRQGQPPGSPDHRGHLQHLPLRDQEIREPDVGADVLRDALQQPVEACGRLPRSRALPIPAQVLISLTHVLSPSIRLIVIRHDRHPSLPPITDGAARFDRPGSHAQ